MENENNIYTESIAEGDMKAAKKAAISSIIAGIGGLVILGFILGFLALNQASKARKLGYKGGLQVVGTILGVLDIIGAFVAIAYFRMS